MKYWLDQQNIIIRKADDTNESVCPAIYTEWVTDDNYELGSIRQPDNTVTIPVKVKLKNKADWRAEYKAETTLIGKQNIIAQMLGLE